MTYADPRVPAEALAPLEMIHGVGGDSLVAMLLRTFLDFADQQLVIAQDSAARGDRAAVARIAHALKSSATQVGIPSMAAVCTAAEAEAGGPDTASAIAYASRMREEFTRASGWMEAIATKA